MTVVHVRKSNDNISLNSRVLDPTARIGGVMDKWPTAIPYKAKKKSIKLKNKAERAVRVLPVTTPRCPCHPAYSDKFACQVLHSLSHCSTDELLGHTKSLREFIRERFSPNQLLIQFFMACQQSLGT